MKRRNSIDWVICAAGEGTRFSRVGIHVPKPKINLDGMSFLERSLMSLDLLPDDRVIIVTRVEHNVRELESNIKTLFPWIDFKWLEINHLTNGQLSTFLLTENLLRQSSSLVIWNCDTYFKSSDLSHLISDGAADAIVPCGKLAGNKWSFYKIKKNTQLVIDVREKKRISPWASVGLYYFKDTSETLKLAKLIVKKQPIHGLSEHYVSSLHSEMLKKGKVIALCGVELFLPFGTPGDVNKYWSCSLLSLKENNITGTIVIDLDNTITIESKKDSYPSKKPNRKVISKLREYKKNGYQVIIFTARNMKTQKGDESLVIGNIGHITLEWLIKHKVPFDGLKFGKPYAKNAFYIDDKAVRPDEFLELSIGKLNQIVKN